MELLNLCTAAFCLILTTGTYAVDPETTKIANLRRYLLDPVRLYSSSDGDAYAKLILPSGTRVSDDYFSSITMACISAMSSHEFVTI